MKNPSIKDIALKHVRVSSKTVWSFIQLNLEDGTTGWGEASLIPAPQALDAHAAQAHTALVGASLETLDAFVTGGGIKPIAQAAVASAIEQASWDVRARLAGCSAASLDGAPVRTHVALYGNINRRTEDRSPAGFLQSAKETLAAGYTTMKIAPFDGVTPSNSATPEGQALVQAGLARVAAVREAGGTNLSLYVDCHWRFNPETAATVLHALADLNVVWFECPLPEIPENMTALQLLRSQANTRGMRQAGLEELTHPDAFLPWLAAGCYDVVMPDVKYAGGIGGLIRVAEFAAQHGTACAPHNPTGPLCHAASLIASAKAPNMERLEHQFDETPEFWSMVEGDLPQPIKGTTRLSKGPGLGVALRQDLSFTSF